MLFFSALVSALLDGPRGEAPHRPRALGAGAAKEIFLNLSVPFEETRQSAVGVKRNTPQFTMILLPLLAVLLSTAGAFVSPWSRRTPSSTSKLHSLKPAALPLMDSGKALARSGEVLIDLTTNLDLYGGSLSACGACIRNCGDALAQAGASARMKTGVEIVIDELREGADCLKEGSLKLATAVDESNVDKDFELSKRLQAMIKPTQQAALRLEEAGASIMQRQSITVVGSHLIACGEAIDMLASSIVALSPDDKDAKLSSQRMNYCSTQMIIAGEELAGIKREKPKGKSWLKG